MLNAYFDPFLFLKLLLFSCKTPLFKSSVDSIDNFIYEIILFLVSTKPTIVNKLHNAIPTVRVF